MPESGVERKRNSILCGKNLPSSAVYEASYPLLQHLGLNYCGISVKHLQGSSTTSSSATVERESNDQLRDFLQSYLSSKKVALDVSAALVLSPTANYRIFSGLVYRCSRRLLEYD